MRGLTPLHRSYLNRHAISDELLSTVDVFSHEQGIVFGWDNGTDVIYTMRPDIPAPDRPKYEWPDGISLRLWTIRENESTNVFLVEGHKQSLAIASWTDLSVYAMNGCWGTSGVDLSAFAGRAVFIVLDSDASSSHDVYSAGARTAEQLKDDGAIDVRFVRVNGSRKEGADDRLAILPPDRRREKIERWLAAATRKPADRRPPRPPADPEPIEGTADRPVVVVNGDRLRVVDQLHGLLSSRWNGWRLFDFGGVLTELADGRTEPLTKDALYDRVPKVATTVRKNKDTYAYDWPDNGTLVSLLYRAGDYLPLTGISRVPFVRDDGSICQVPGYDLATGVFLLGGLEDVDVPAVPTADDVSSAVSLLLDDWLGDMPFSEEADRANALALLLTPLVRKMMPLVPLAVVDGLQMGVGKNLFADLVAILATGQPAAPLPYSSTDDEENRKVITSAFRSGSDLFVFDEAHELQGRSLARAITSVTYQDRVLGVSTVAEFPNSVTWMSLGNNVTVNGDMSRRVYRIRLAPTGANPQDRGEDQFRHPEIREWTLKNRAALLTAALTLVRAWYVAGCPRRPSSFGSFEAWERVIGGVLHVAGVPGFLGNLQVWRSESDYDAQHWAEHLTWLWGTFGTQDFRVADVAARIGHGAPTPPGLDDTLTRGYPRLLGKAYGKIKGRWIGRYQLTVTGTTDGSNRWGVRIHN